MKTKVFIVFITLLVLFSFFNTVRAANLSEMYGQTRDFINKGKDGAPEVSDAVNQIFDIGSILTSIGVAVMLGVTAYMGIKYLTAGPDAKAKLKQQLIGVVVAGFVIFGSYYIWKIVINVASQL